MARKFFQMGWTRARRYANHKGGRKYDKQTGEELPRVEDAEKTAAAADFYERYAAARQHSLYLRLTKEHQEKHQQKEKERPARQVWLACGATIAATNSACPSKVPSDAYFPTFGLPHVL
jgi:hypothetical protein